MSEASIHRVGEDPCPKGLRCESPRLEVVNAPLNATFENEVFEAIGGLVFDRLRRAPQAGDRVAENEYGLKGTRMDGTC